MSNGQIRAAQIEGLAEQLEALRGQGITTGPIFDSPADSTIRTLAESIANQANKFTLNTWLPATFAGSSPITPTANTESAVRPAASAAVGLAATLATGTHDESATGTTEANARAACLRLTSGLAASHVANGGIWGGSTANPPNASDGTANWQAANWSTRAALAAWLTAEDLSAADLENVAAMVAHEADRMLGWALPYYRNTAGAIVYTGDTKAEEIAWDATALQCAAIMLPGHANAAAWWGKLLEMGIAAYSAPADLTSTERLNGLVVGDILNGSNINSDGSVTNANKVAPDYMVSGAEGLWALGSMLNTTGRVMPTATQRNADTIYAALNDNFYVDGSYTLLYPDGNIWGTDRMMHVALMDVLAYLHQWDTGLDTTAETWALLHLQRQADLQARDTTGQTYQAPGEDTYAGREQWVAQLAGMAVLALHAGTPVVSNAPGDVVRQQALVPYPATVTAPAEALAALVPWTTTGADGEPAFMWDDDNNLITTEEST